MIHLHNPDGLSIYLAPEAIAKVSETGPSARWHNINSMVKTFDNRLLEVREEAAEIAALVAAARKEQL